MAYYIANSTQLDFNGLANIPTPSATDTHVPIPHASLVSLVLEGLADRNFVIEETRYAVDKFNDMFGIIKMHTNNGTYNNVLGIRNSHNKRFSASACSGSSVMVCDNLSFSGDHIISRKHTRHIMRDIADKINGLMTDIVTGWATQEHRFTAYRSRELSSSDFNELLGDAIQSHAIQPSKALKVAEEYHNPRHDAFEKRNAWSAFNAFTEIYKESPQQINNAHKRSIALHGVFDRFCAEDIEAQVMYNEPEELDSLLAIPQPDEPLFSTGEPAVSDWM